MDQIEFEKIAALVNNSPLLAELSHQIDPDDEINLNPPKPIWVEPRPTKLVPELMYITDLTTSKIPPASKTSPPPAIDTWVHLRFDAIEDPDSGEMLNLTAKIPMKYPPEFYQLPTEEELKHVVDWVENWLMEQKLVRKRQTEKIEMCRSLARDMAIARGFIMPDGEFTSEKNCLGVTGAMLVFLLDDLVEETDLLGRHSADAHLVADYISEALKKVEENPEDEELKEEDLPKPDFSKFPAMIPIWEASKVLGRRLQVYAPKNYKKNSKYALSDAKDTYSAVLCTQLSDKDKEDIMSEETFKFLRAADAAARPAVECMIRYKEILLLDKIRQNLIFQRLKFVFALLIGCQNDILGIRKDLVKNEPSIVYHKRKYGNDGAGMCLKDAFEEVAALLEFQLKELNYCIERLRTAYPDNQELEDYLHNVFVSMDINSYLIAYSNRYGELRSAIALAANNNNNNNK